MSPATCEVDEAAWKWRIRKVAEAMLIAEGRSLNARNREGTTAMQMWRTAFGMLVYRARPVLWSPLILVALCPLPTAGQAPEPPKPQDVTATVANLPTITNDQIEADLKRVEETTSIDDALKKRMRAKYEAALELMRSAAQSQRQQAQYETWTSDALPEMRDVLDDLRQQSAPFDIEAAKNEPLTKLRPALEKLERQYVQLIADLAKLEDEPRRRAARRVEIPKERAAAEKRLADAVSKLREDPQPDQPLLWTQADRAFLAAQRQAAIAELAALEQEELALLERKELLPKRRELASRENDRIKKDVEALRALVAQRGTNEAKEQAAEVLREVPANVRGDPYFAGPVQRVEQLAEKWTTRAAELATLSTKLAELESSSKKVDDAFDLTRSRVDGGTTPSFGLVLRRERAELPSVGHLRRDVARRDKAIRQARSNLYVWQLRQSELRDLEAAVKAELVQLPSRQPPEDQPPEDQPPESHATVAALLKGEQKIIDGLVTDTEAYLNQLVRVNSDAENFADLVEQYAGYIDERVYWVQSTGVLAPVDFRKAFVAAIEFLSSAQWSNLWGRLAQDARRQPLMYILPFVAITVLIYFQTRIRRRIHALGQSVSRSAYLDFAPTVRVLLLTFLNAAPWSALLLYVSVRLMRLWTEAGGDLLRAMASGFTVAALALFALQAAYQVCRPMGLAEAHFRWHADVLKIIRRNLRTLVFCGTPLVFVVVTLETLASLSPRQYDAHHNSLGRLCFIALQLLVLLTLQRTFRPNGGVLGHLERESPASWLARLRNVWFAAILLVPVALGGLAVAGLYDTSLHLGTEMFVSAVMIVLIVILGALLERWVRVGRRRLAIRQALESQAQRPVVEGAEGVAPVESDLDLSQINDQLKKLIRSSMLLVGLLGLWLIWQDVLPALSLLDNVTVIPLGPESSISLADLLFILVSLVVTIIAARRGPSLIEFLLLQRLPLPSSVRYAVSSLAQYVIVALGVVVTAGYIGIQWDLLIWLLAPLGVGLGFGLQEIFSNFVCGIVLLFEQPLRVGDVVTVGDTTGVVTRIRIRATTIRNWDQQELILPNKNLITGSFVNWTLSDTTNRIVIQIGVAYGTDTDRAREILHEVLRENSDIVDEPAPLVIFEGFGESTLNIVVRGYLSSMDHRLSATHALHTRINQRFHEEGIEFAFPQRDLHIRGAPQSWTPGGANGKHGSQQPGPSQHSSSNQQPGPIQQPGPSPNPGGGLASAEVEPTDGSRA